MNCELEVSEFGLTPSDILVYSPYYSVVIFVKKNRILFFI